MSGMRETLLLPLLGIIITSLPTVTGQCPVGCFCLAGYVTCSDLKSIPSVFPDDTRSISISNINAAEIPAGIFDKLPMIESIEIYQGKIGKISTGAFRSLSYFELISLNELTIGTIEPYAFSNITDVGTISIYMSQIDTIRPYAFWDIFALDEIKLFMIDVANIDSFALSNIDELFHFSFYTNTIGSMHPYAFSNFANVHKLSMYLNNFGQLGCGSVEALVSETYEHWFYSNHVNCSCDLLWIPKDDSLKKYMFSNWCQIPDTDEKIFWEDLSSDTLECDSKEENDVCPSAIICEMLVEPFTDVTKATSRVPHSTTRSLPPFTYKTTSNSLGVETTTFSVGKTKSTETPSPAPEHSSLPSVTSTPVFEHTTSRPESSTTSSTETAVKTSTTSSTETAVKTSTTSSTETAVKTSRMSSTETAVKISRMSSTETAVKTSRAPSTATAVKTSRMSSTETADKTSRTPSTETAVKTSRMSSTETADKTSRPSSTETAVKSSRMSSTENADKTSRAPSTETAVKTSRMSSTETADKKSRASSTVAAVKNSTPSVPSSERSTTEQTTTHLKTVISSMNALSTTKEPSTVTDATLISTKHGHYDTQPNVVISNTTSVIKAVTDTRDSAEQPQPHNVSFREDDNDVSSSTQSRGCLSVLLLTLTLIVI